jgi:hypothetical protein
VLTLRNCLFSRRRLAADWSLLARIYRKRGAAAAARIAASIASAYGRQVLMTTVLRPADTFTVKGEHLRYLRHWHVTTFLNERTVELPIVVEELRRIRPARLLEIGNVLNYYVQYPHVVVDKYEVAPGVLNEDVVDFRAAEPFDMIVSISTIEHVGWDETPKDPAKTIRAIEHLRTLLVPGGRLVCTLPLRYNPHLDAHLAAGRLPFDEVRYLRRLNARNEWQEATPDEVAGSKYGDPYVHANALAVGFASRRDVR